MKTPYHITAYEDTRRSLEKYKPSVQMPHQQNQDVYAKFCLQQRRLTHAFQQFGDVDMYQMACEVIILDVSLFSASNIPYLKELCANFDQMYVEKIKYCKQIFKPKQKWSLFLKEIAIAVFNIMIPVSDDYISMETEWKRLCGIRMEALQTDHFFVLDYYRISIAWNKWVCANFVYFDIKLDIQRFIEAVFHHDLLVMEIETWPLLEIDACLSSPVQQLTPVKTKHLASEPKTVLDLSPIIEEDKNIKKRKYSEIISESDNSSDSTITSFDSEPSEPLFEIDETLCFDFPFEFHEDCEFDTLYCAEKVC